MAWSLGHLYDVPPPARSPGHLTMGYDEDGRWTVLSTPLAPVVYASGQLLRELYWGAPDFITIRYPPLSLLTGDFIDGIIQLRGDDCQLAYVVRRKVHDDPEIWEVSWPD